jgi:hypothetical protein
VDAQSQRENFACDKRQMRILDIPEQEFCAGIEEDNAHGRSTNVEHPTSNVQYLTPKSGHDYAHGTANTPFVMLSFDVRCSAFDVFCEISMNELRSVLTIAGLVAGIKMRRGR